MSLVACPSCARHVRASERACAFCGADFATSSGAARFAIAVAIVASAAAMGCQNQKEMAQPYGVPMPPDNGRDAAANPLPTTPVAPDGGASGK